MCTDASWSTWLIGPSAHTCIASASVCPSSAPFSCPAWSCTTLGAVCKHVIECTNMAFRGSHALSPRQLHAEPWTKPLQLEMRGGIDGIQPGGLCPPFRCWGSQVGIKVLSRTGSHSARLRLCPMTCIPVRPAADVWGSCCQPQLSC